MSASFWQALLTILFGSIAGGVTNSVAIWMLFHPYSPPRLFGRRLTLLQGAIPKNQARLARAIGNAVGTRLLTPDDLAQTLTDPRFRSLFEERLEAFIRDLIARRQGSLSEILPPSLVIELRAVLSEVSAGLLSHLEIQLESEEFEARLIRWVTEFQAEFNDLPLSELLTPEREEALRRVVEGWLADLAVGRGLERVVREYLDRTFDKLLVPGRTFEELLPPGLIATAERAIAGYLPLVLERLGGLLEDEEIRELVQRALGGILERFMRDLRFHQRLVASLLITPETIEKVLRAVEAEGATKLSEILKEESARDVMARGVNDAIIDLLQRPIDSIFGRPGDPNVEEAKATLVGWVLKLARDPQTRGFLIEKLGELLERVEGKNWGDLLRHLPPDRIASLIAGVVRSDRARSLYHSAAEQVVSQVLERPIGRLGDHLAVDTPERLQRALADPIWGWLEEEVPELARRIDIARQIERKILDFPMSRVEELIRSVTERELHLIVRLGYLLGAVIGGISATLNLVLG